MSDGVASARGRPRVLLVSLGGTIAMTDDGSGGVSTRLDGDELVAGAPGLEAIADVRPVAYRRLPGAHLSFEDVIELAAYLQDELTGGNYTGAVVTQGTDTIEETAFALDLLLDVDAPAVVTGAMRNATAVGADGVANVLASVRVAVDASARGLGTLVVMNDEIHAARHVQKRHTANMAAFASVVGPLGWVAEDVVQILLRPTRQISLILPVLRTPADVALVTTGFSDSGVLLEALDGRVEGVVVEALGAGHVVPAMLKPIDRLVARVPVVLASRTGRGEVLRATYEFPGSERDLLRRGLLRAGWLDGRKARVLLSLLLRAGLARDEVEAAFREVAEGAPAGAGVVT